MPAYTFHPGETLVLNFVIPFGEYDVQAVALTFRDVINKNVVFETLATGKKYVDEDHVRVGFTLTQEESLLFREYAEYTMQLNVYGGPKSGSRETSKEILVKTLSQHLITPDFSSIAAPDITPKESTSTVSDGANYESLSHLPTVNGYILVGNVSLYHVASDAEIDAAIEECLEVTLNG